MEKKQPEGIERRFKPSSTEDSFKNNVVSLLLMSAFLFAIRPRPFALNYPFIPKEMFRLELVKKTTDNLRFVSSLETPYCSYDKIIDENRLVFEKPNLSSIFNESNIQPGGEFIPTQCVPKFSTAIIIPYRNRELQLNAFIKYIHNFLRLQNIHYRIFVVEQADDKPFNRAKLFNIGYTYANKLNFPCMVLHDVDLLPMNLGNLYVCTQRPRHMAANLNKFRFYLPFGDYFGGVVSIRTKHYEAINGISNLFEGWGGEDDDFFYRLILKDIVPYRVPPEFNLYTMFLHKQETPNEGRQNLLENTLERHESDGINSLEFTELDFRLNKLYTHILAQT